MFVKENGMFRFELKENTTCITLRKLIGYYPDSPTFLLKNDFGKYKHKTHKNSHHLDS